NGDIRQRNELSAGNVRGRKIILPANLEQDEVRVMQMQREPGGIHEHRRAPLRCCSAGTCSKSKQCSQKASSNRFHSPPPANYSQRNASIGSIAAARRAGM